MICIYINNWKRNVFAVSVGESDLLPIKLKYVIYFFSPTYLQNYELTGHQKLFGILYNVMLTLVLTIYYKWYHIFRVCVYAYTNVVHVQYYAVFPVATNYDNWLTEGIILFSANMNTYEQGHKPII